MFTSEKSTISAKRSVSTDQSSLPLLGGDKKNDGHQSERLYVKIKSGDTSEIEIDISESETVDELKAKLVAKLNIIGKRVRLIASGRMLEPGSKYLIADFKVNPGAFIHVVITENIPNYAVGSNGPALNESTPSAPSNTTFRGLDQLSEADMTADEVAAVRSSFLRSIDRFGVQNGLQRAPDETPTTFRFRLEEIWMDAQETNSEFYMNLPPEALRLRSSRIATRGGFSGVSSTGAEGNNMFSMTSLQISRNDYSLSDDESSVGTLRDFMLGIVVGYFLGGIMLFCLWDRGFTHKFKVGILIGVTLQIFSGVAQSTGQPGTNPAGSTVAVTQQPGLANNSGDGVAHSGNSTLSLILPALSSSSTPSASSLILPAMVSSFDLALLSAVIPTIYTALTTPILSSSSSSSSSSSEHVESSILLHGASSPSSSLSTHTSSPPLSLPPSLSLCEAESSQALSHPCLLHPTSPSPLGRLWYDPSVLNLFGRSNGQKDAQSNTHFLRGSISQ